MWPVKGLANFTNSIKKEFSSHCQQNNLKASPLAHASHLSHTIGHLQGQVLQNLLPDDIVTDLLRGLAGQDPAVKLPRAWLGLHQEVALSAQNTHQTR